MTHAKCQAPKINGCAFKVPRALKHRSSTSFLPPLGAKSGVPSCIVGVAVGNQVIQSHIKVGSYPMTEEKAHANKYIQHAELVFEMKKQNEVDVRNREDKIVKLKQYIADTFQEKSREHQQQMDELRTELNRFEEKMHILKTKLGKEIRSRK